MTFYHISDLLMNLQAWLYLCNSCGSWVTNLLGVCPTLREQDPSMFNHGFKIDYDGRAEDSVHVKPWVKFSARGLVYLRTQLGWGSTLERRCVWCHHSHQWWSCDSTNTKAGILHFREKLFQRVSKSHIQSKYPVTLVGWVFPPRVSKFTYLHIGPFQLDCHIQVILSAVG